MKEEEIRPKDVFDEYLRLAESDINRFFVHDPRTEILCPACGKQGEFSFQKKGFNYQVCPHCATLYVSPRPSPEAFVKYYKESESIKFCATSFYKVTAEARREKLWKPKAQMVWDILLANNALHHEIIDIGGGYGIFAEEYEKLSPKKVSIIEPGPLLAKVCENKGLSVIEAFLEAVDPEQLPEGPKAFVSFELFEHLHNPESFLSCLTGLMKAGDLFLFTTLSSLGVDIQALWEDSKSVFPPHHLNFFNPYSVKVILQGKGLEVLEVSTPGKLDIDILCNSSAHIKDRFWQRFVKHADDDQKALWQRTIAESGWSSHMMVLAKKP